jgi:hypothetical protein
MRMVNPAVRRVLASRLLGRRIGKLALVEVRGRRTGRTVRIPMGLHDIDGTPTAFTSRPWRFNFTGGATVTVVHRGVRRTARGTLIDAPPRQVGTALHTALDHGASPFDLGLKIGKRHEPTVNELGAAGLHMLQFDLSEGIAS